MRTKVAGALERAIIKQNVDTTVKESETIALFYSNHGYKLRQKAYGVKRRTLLNWQNQILKNMIDMNGLIYGNRAPKYKMRNVL